MPKDAASRTRQVREMEADKMQYLPFFSEPSVSLEADGLSKSRTPQNCVVAFLTAVLLASAPVQASKPSEFQIVGWWGYDKACPASDDGFGLEAGGRANDGRGAYLGRWSHNKDEVRIVWEASASERPHIKPSEWRIVETFRLVHAQRQRTMLVNTKNGQSAWLCWTYPRPGRSAPTNPAL